MLHHRHNMRDTVVSEDSVDDGCGERSPKLDDPEKPNVEPGSKGSQILCIY